MVIAASILILSPSLLDVGAVKTATAGFSNTMNAIIGLIGVFVTARIVDALGKRRADKRDKERFQGMSTIAFRSLSQAVNDVGRVLLAPAVGADLYSAGIPGFTAADHSANLSLLRSVGIEPQMESTSGFWNHIDDSKLAVDLSRLYANHEFVAMMLRVTSSARRRLQDSMAEWAPVMISVPEANDELGPGWVLADQLVLLAESWRALSVEPQIKTGAPSDESVERTHTHYFEAIRQYRSWLDLLQTKANLPTQGFVTAGGT